MGSVFTCKLNPCCGDRYNCEPPRQYSDPEPALASVAPSGAEPTQAVPAEDVGNLIAATEAELAAGSASTMDWNTRSIALVRRLLAALARVTEERNAYIKACDDYERDLKHSEAEATSLRRKLEEAERQREALILQLRETGDVGRDALSRLDIAEGEANKLRKALEPFAAAKEHFDGHVRDEDTVNIALRHIRAHHVRTAARALSGASE